MAQPSFLHFLAVAALGIAVASAFKLQFARKPSRRTLPTAAISLAVGLTCLTVAVIAAPKNDEPQRATLPRQCHGLLKFLC